MILQGNAFRLPIKDESVHMVVTSPPYFGLRNYEIPPLILGGDEECVHQWNSHRTGLLHDNRQGLGSIEVSSKGKPHGKAHDSDAHSCSLCGAWRGSLGLEPSPDLYVQHLVEIFREIKRVLRKDGTVFLNLGDAYAGSGKGIGSDPDPKWAEARCDEKKSKTDWSLTDSKPKDLLGIPWQVALALQKDGWWLRSDIIWHKPNPMPESINGCRWERHKVKVGTRKAHFRGKAYANQGHEQDNSTAPSTSANQDIAQWADCPGCPKCLPNDGLVLRKGSWRPTRSHEYIFLLTKSDQYFCDAESVREIANYDGRKDTMFKGSAKYADGFNPVESHQGSYLKGHERWTMTEDGNYGRNLRSVWTISTQPFKGSHFATFPEKLVEQCIKAGTSEKGCCPECKSPWVRVVEREWRHQDRSPKMVDQDVPGNPMYRGGHHNDGLPYQGRSKASGWRSSCTCWRDGMKKVYTSTPKKFGEWVELADEVVRDYSPTPCIVLDPFGGSGTVLKVAKELGRNAVVIDLKYDYCRMAQKRNAQGVLI